MPLLAERICEFLVPSVAWDFHNVQIPKKCPCRAIRNYSTPFLVIILPSFPKTS